MEKSSQILKLDFSSIEFAKMAEEQELTEAQIQVVGMVFEHLQRKKIETTIHTLLKMSRLPLKDPKTFDNFDFSVMKGAGCKPTENEALPVSNLCPQKPGIHWSSRNRQDPSGPSLWV